MTALDRLQRRGPLNAEAAQLRLLLAWEVPGTALPPAEGILNAAYLFSEAGEVEFTRRCIGLLEGIPAFALDLDLLRYRCGLPTLKAVPRLPMVFATNVGHLSSAEANQRQDWCMGRLERTRDEDGAIRLVNVGYAEELHGRPGWREVAVTRSARDLVSPSSPRMPLMAEVLQGAYEVAREEGYAYFAFLNSDIVVPPEGLFAIRQMLSEGYETLGLSRTDIPAEGMEAPEHWIELHLSGTDLFVFKTEWWGRNSHLFDQYLLGTKWWDCVFMGILMAHSNCYYLSQHRGILLHVVHSRPTVDSDPHVIHNISMRERRDSVYFFLHCQYIKRLKAYLHKQHSLPGISSNQELILDRFIAELRTRLAPPAPASPALAPAWCAPEAQAGASGADLIKRTGGAASPLWPSARMEDAAAAARAEAGLAELPAAWFAETGQDALMLWWSGRRAQLLGQHLLALIRFREALALGFGHWRLALHALESARALGMHRLVAACAGLLAPRAEALAVIQPVLQRLGAAGAPRPVHDPALLPAEGVPLGDHILLTALSGWRGVERIRRAHVIGAHRFEEKELLFRTFPDLQEVCLFEPIPECLEDLRRLHGNDPRIRIVPCAISDRSGSALFHLSSNDGLSSSLLPFGTHSRYFSDLVFTGDIQVPCRTLDDAMAEFALPEPDLLFMDVQGSEFAILSALSARRLQGIQILFTEVSLEEVYRGGRTLPDLSALLADRFQCSGYAPTAGLQGMHGNALFLNRAFLEAVDRDGPSPLLDLAHPAPQPRGQRLEPGEAAALGELIRVQLSADLLGEGAALAPAREIYLWGAGAYGRGLVPILGGLGLGVQGILDNGAGHWGETVLGLPVLEPGPVLARTPRPFICIGTVHHAAVEQQLELLGFIPGRDFRSLPAPV